MKAIPAILCQHKANVHRPLMTSSGGDQESIV